MKTKIIIPGLLAALMLVTVPIITVAMTETPEIVTLKEMPSLEETSSEDTTLEEPREEVPKIEEQTEEETTPEQTEYFSFGYVKASFSGIYDNEVDFDHGLFFAKDIVVTATLTKPLKVNGETIVESGTHVKVEIDRIGNLGFRLTMNCMTGGIPRYSLGLSGFASGITVTY